MSNVDYLMVIFPEENIATGDEIADTFGNAWFSKSVKLRDKTTKVFSHYGLKTPSTQGMINAMPQLKIDNTGSNWDLVSDKSWSQFLDENNLERVPFEI